MSTLLSKAPRATRKIRYRPVQAEAHTTHRVHLLVSESTGALSRAVTTLLSCLAKAVRAPDGHDSTVYGTGRASTKSFYTHHVAAISSAIVRADALLVRNAAASLAFQLAHAPGPS